MIIWKCLNESCRHQFWADDILPWLQKGGIGWRWCPNCRASSRRLCCS